MQPGDGTTNYVTVDTYLVVQCAQYLSRYAKPAECRLLLSLILFAIGVFTGVLKWMMIRALRVENVTCLRTVSQNDDVTRTRPQIEDVTCTRTQIDDVTCMRAGAS